MDNEFNNQNINQPNENLNDKEVNNEVVDNKNINNQYNNKKNNDSSIPVIIMIIILILFVFVFLGNDDNLFSNDNKQENGGNIVDSNKDDKLEDSQVNKNDKVQEENNKLNYEINTEVDSSTGVKKHYLYLNGKKVYDIKADEELGSIEVKELKDLLIVDEQNPGPSRKLFVVDNSGNATEIDYKVSTYNTEFINTIDSYRVEDNNLYIKVNRQWGNGYIDWYCRYEDKNEVAEYEVKYEYVNGKLENKQVLNEVTIADKYKNEKCNNDNNEGKNENNQYENNNVESLNCTYNGELVQGAEYVNGQYTYRYMQEYTQNGNGVTEWMNISQNGWGVILTDKESMEPVTTKLCSSINGKPIVSMSYMFNERKGTLPYGAVKDFPCQSTSIDLSSFDTSNVTNMMGMFHLNNVTTLDLSGFDISNVTNMTNIFLGDELTIVYAKNQEDADRFNSSMGKPVTLKIVVK